ncbi:MAG: fibronectin type III domain-containing protein [Acidobacteria bacterium]|nr:fibronectin type III domain-containing protein [Acidobacteriota bacterium]
MALALTGGLDPAGAQVRIRVPAPGPFTKFEPSNQSTDRRNNPTLRWTRSVRARTYEYCLDTKDNGTCDTRWVPVAGQTSARPSGLADDTTYYWQVQAKNPGGATPANGDAWFSFRTRGGQPGEFTKLSPTNRAVGQRIDPTLQWQDSAGATSYEYCFDTNANDECDTGWQSVDTDTSANLRGLAPGTEYFWQVQARNDTGMTPANAGIWWSFRTR